MKIVDPNARSKTERRTPVHFDGLTQDYKEILLEKLDARKSDVTKNLVLGLNDLEAAESALTDSQSQSKQYEALATTSIEVAYKLLSKAECVHGMMFSKRDIKNSSKEIPINYESGPRSEYYLGYPIKGAMIGALAGAMLNAESFLLDPFAPLSFTPVVNAASIVATVGLLLGCALDIEGRIIERCAFLKENNLLSKVDLIHTIKSQKSQLAVSIPSDARKKIEKQAREEVKQHEMKIPEEDSENRLQRHIKIVDGLLAEVGNNFFNHESGKELEMLRQRVNDNEKLVKQQEHTNYTLNSQIARIQEQSSESSRNSAVTRMAEALIHSVLSLMQERLKVLSVDASVNSADLREVNLALERFKTGDEPATQESPNLQSTNSAYDLFELLSNRINTLRDEPSLGSISSALQTLRSSNGLPFDVEEVKATILGQKPVELCDVGQEYYQDFVSYVLRQISGAHQSLDQDGLNLSNLQHPERNSQGSRTAEVSGNI